MLISSCATSDHEAQPSSADLTALADFASGRLRSM
jgi:hypothetical protein